MGDGKEKMMKTMRKLFVKALIAVGSCAFFTFLLPVLMTTAQRNLFFAGWAIAFCFFGLCLYLVMTSKFFNNGGAVAEDTKAEKELTSAE